MIIVQRMGVLKPKVFRSGIQKTPGHAEGSLRIEFVRRLESNHSTDEERHGRRVDDLIPELAKSSLVRAVRDVS